MAKSLYGPNEELIKKAFPYIVPNMREANNLHETWASYDVKLCTLNTDSLKGWYVVLYWDNEHQEDFLTTAVLKDRDLARWYESAIINQRAYEYSCGKPLSSNPPQAWEGLDLADCILPGVIPENILTKIRLNETTRELS